MPITYESPKINVRFEDDQLKKLKADAKKNERSLPAHIRWIVKQHLAK